MQFGHEQIDVYRVSIRYVAWAYKLAKRLRCLQSSDNETARCERIPAGMITPITTTTTTERVTPRVFILRLWEHISVMRFPSCRDGTNIIDIRYLTTLHAQRKTEDEKLHEVAQIEQPR